MPNKVLGVFCPDPTDSTSFYRGVGPLSELRKVYFTNRESLSLCFFSQVSWATLKMCDYLFFQRPATPNMAQIIKRAKYWSIPIWIDYDDFLFDIPADNPCYELYMNETANRAMLDCLHLADVVTVSTDALAEQLKQYCKKIVVIRNAFDLSFLARKPEITAINKLVLWRGSNTHDADLQSVEDALIELSHKNPSWTWLFAGCKPGFFHRMKNCLHQKNLDIFEYHELIFKSRPSLMIVPLVDSTFNRCKSDCALLEGTYAGARVIAPDFHAEFTTDTCMKYPTGEGYNGFKHVMQAHLDMDLTDLLALRNQAWHTVKTERTLEVANQTRARVLDYLREIS